MTAITTAARLLREAAAELKNAHTLGGDWGNELEALDAYNEHMATATTLEHMARQCLAQIEEPAQHTRVVLDDRWKTRMLDGRAIERDEMGLGDHPELPMLDEGMMPRSFFAALGLELAHTSAEDQLDWDVLGAMSEAVNWTDWQPNPPHGDGWKLVSIFDTEDGPVAWWLRELPEAEDGTTTIRILQAEVEKLKARIARAGAAPAAVAGPAWDKTRDSLATLLLGLARRPFLDFDVACIALDAATEPGMPLAYMRSAPAAPALEAPQGEYPHEQMDAMALARYKVVPSHASMLWSHAVVAGDGAQQLYVGREVECQNMARKFAGAFLDGAFAFHSMAAAPTAPQAPAQEAPAAPAVPAGFALVPLRLTRAMDEAISEEGWQWEDLLAAAQAVTEEQYEASAQDRLSRDEVRAIFLECGFVIKEGQNDLKPYVYEAAQVLESRVRSIAAAAPQAPAAPTWDQLREMAIKHGAWVSGYGPFATELLATYGRAPEDQPHWVAQWMNAVRAMRAAPAAPAVDAQDAARWRAFIASDRIRFFGWAGADSEGRKEEKNIYDEPNGNYVHFGAEFWSVHAARTEAPETAARLLTTYADACIAAQAAAKGSA